MGEEVSAKQAQSAAEAAVAALSEKFSDATIEVRHHTGGTRKHAYVFIDVPAPDWRAVAESLAADHGVDYCAMITGVHWPEKLDAMWQVIVHLTRTGVRDPTVDGGRVHEIKADIPGMDPDTTPLEFEVTMAVAETREPKVPSVADIWVGADWNEKETWDLVGIDFEGHVGMRRVLLPHDSPTGYHPLQKQHRLRYHDFNEMYDDAQGFGRKPVDIGKVK